MWCASPNLAHRVWLSLQFAQLTSRAATYPDRHGCRSQLSCPEPAIKVETSAHLTSSVALFHPENINFAEEGEKRDKEIEERLPSLSKTILLTMRMPRLPKTRSPPTPRRHKPEDASPPNRLNNFNHQKHKWGDLNSQGKQGNKRRVRRLTSKIVRWLVLLDVV